MMVERNIYAAIVAVFRAEPRCWHFKVHGSIFQRIGLPDYIACVRGAFVAVEVKTRIGVTSKMQDYRAKQLRRCGAVTAVVTSADEVRDLLAGIPE